MLKLIRLTDFKTDIFLAANVMDAHFTYLALQLGTHVTEFNSIISTAIGTIGTSTALFLEVVLCVVALWILRRVKKEYLFVPLSVIFVMVALSNYIVIQLLGIEV